MAWGAWSSVKKKTMLGRFAANAKFEIRNPMRMMRRVMKWSLGREGVLGNRKNEKAIER